jgi:acetolactate synthase small subunit
MITFRPKKQKPINLVQKAIDYLTNKQVPFSIIKEKEADMVSQRSSKSIVLLEFIQNEMGLIQIKLQDKKLYSWTEKMISEIFRMNITDIDEKSRIITATSEHEGHVLDVIEILGLKYNLSIVK